MYKYHRLLRYDWPLHFVLTILNFLPDNIIFLKLRGYFASFFFFKTGKNIQIGRDVTFYDPSKIIIGSNVYFAKGTWICGGEKIIIGSNILFAPYSIIVTSNHKFKNGGYFNDQTTSSGNVIIDDGCWMGAHSVILGGSHLKSGTLIAANSVFKGSSEENSIYAGNPIKFIKYASEKT